MYQVAASTRLFPGMVSDGLVAVVSSEIYVPKLMLTLLVQSKYETHYKLQQKENYHHLVGNFV